MLFIKHGIEIEQLNIVLNNVKPKRSQSYKLDKKAKPVIVVDSEDYSSNLIEKVQDEEIGLILEEVDKKVRPNSPKRMVASMMETAKQKADQNYKNFSQRANGALNSNRKRKRHNRGKAGKLFGRYADVFELMRIPDLQSI